MRVTLFRHRTESVPFSVKDLAWNEFVAQLRPENPHAFDNKNDLPAFSFAEFPAGATRANRNAVRCHALALDFDNLSDDALEKLLVRVEKYRGVLYTTWSHYAKPNKVRVILALSRPVECDDWPPFWVRAHAMFPECDGACKDISRIYFLPYAPAPNEPVIAVFTGEPVDVDAWLKMPAAASRHPMNLAKLSARLTKRDKELGSAMAKAAIGEPFAHEGERDTVAWRLAQALAEEWPDEPAEVLADQLRPSLDAMALVAADAPTVENLTDKIRRAQDAWINDITAVEREARLARQGRLADLGREAPYSEAEIDTICTEQGVTRELLRRRWLVVRDSAIYVLAPGGYRGPYTPREAPTAILRDLSPATSAGVSLHKATTRTVIRKNIDVLLEEYGSACNDAIIDMLAPFTRYDGDKIIEAPLKWRNIQPVYHADIDEWLALLAGERVEKLRNWLAAVPMLDKPCSALLLVGSPGTGKSLLASGLAKIWGPTPVDMATAMSGFNAAITRMPLILADEFLPKDFKGGARTGELRKLVQDRTRLVHRKFLPDMECHGALRFIIAANNNEVIGFNETLNSDDIGAIAERFLHIQCDKQAAVYLRDKDTLAWAERFIAEHAVWLNQNHTWVPDGRFLVHGGGESIRKTIATLSGCRSDITRWLVSWVFSPRSMVGLVGAIICKYKGMIAVHPGTVEKHWTVYMPANMRPPKYGEILRTLDAMSQQGADCKIGGTRAKLIRLEPIIDWLLATDYCSEDEFRRTFDAITENYRGKQNYANQ